MQNTEKIWQLVDARKDAYEALSDRVWEIPEICYTEYRSVAEHRAMLEEEGFRITESLAGIPTAIMGEAGEGGPVIAIQTGIQLGVDPRAFGMMVAVAASCSYLTPLEPSCLMVYGPGKYQFFDFFKVGLPLTVLIYAVSIVLVPWVWPM